MLSGFILALLIVLFVFGGYWYNVRMTVEQRRQEVRLRRIVVERLRKTIALLQQPSSAVEGDELKRWASALRTPALKKGLLGADETEPLRRGISRLEMIELRHSAAAAGPPRKPLEEEIDGALRHLNLALKRIEERTLRMADVSQL